MRSIFHTDAASILAAIGRSMAVIEFKPDGRIITANENFCRTLGYALPEIVGQHHRIFVEPSQAQSSDYAAFWLKLGKGAFVTDAFKRIAKGGREIWIQAS